MLEINTKISITMSMTSWLYSVVRLNESVKLNFQFQSDFMNTLFSFGLNKHMSHIVWFTSLIFDIWNHLANALIMWKIFFEKHIWWFPLIKGRYFYIQGFDSLTYLNPCKNEVCFNILSIWTSYMAFLLHVKR